MGAGGDASGARLLEADGLFAVGLRSAAAAGARLNRRPFIGALG